MPPKQGEDSKVVAGGQKAVDGTKKAAKAAERLAEEKYLAANSLYDRIFLKHINREFGDNIELALRAAVFILACGIPFFMPQSFCPMCYWIVRTKFYSSTSICYFIFTLYKSTGCTIYFAKASMTGTALAVLNIWLMMGFMPGGYQLTPPNDSYWWPGIIWGCVYVFLMLWLNMDGNCRVFGLSTFVFYWMAFLNHTVRTGFNTHFKVSLNGKAASEFVIAISGCGIAVVASCLPFPILAIWKAQKCLDSSVDQLKALWTDFLDYYCGDDKNPYLQHALNRAFAELKASVSAIDGYLDEAWYECLGLGKWQRQRLMIKKVDAFVNLAFDRISVVMDSCTNEDFEDSHDKLMAATREKFLDTIGRITGMLDMIVCAVKDGGFSDESKELVNSAVDDITQSIAELTSGFGTACKDQDMYKVNDDVGGEMVVACTLCNLGREVSTLAKQLQEPLQDNPGSWKDGVGMLGTFQPSYLFDKDHINWTVRNGTSIMLAFVLGFNGYSKMIMSYNASIACLACLMMSNSAGSAMGNNLMRLQGIVLGTVIGQIAYVLLGWCVWWGYISVALFVFIWGGASIFVYYNSAQFSTVGILCAVFGVMNVLSGCTDEVFQPAGAYYAVINATLAICIMTVVDMALSPGRCSDMAQEAYLNAWEATTKAVATLFDSNSQKMPPRTGGVRGAINRAARMNVEAFAEPRYHRGPWPVDEFNGGLNTMRTIRFSLATIENAMVECGETEWKKSEHFMQALKKDSFADVLDALLSEMEYLKGLAERTLSKDSADGVFELRLRIKGGKTFTRKNSMSQQSHAERVKKAMQQLEQDLTNIIASESTECKTLEEDPACDYNLLVASLNGMFSQLEACHQGLASLQ